MRVANKQLPFSSKWDKKLKYLISNGKPTLLRRAILRFTIIEITPKTYTFIGLKCTINKTLKMTYDVWRANKTCCYGHLAYFNGVDVKRQYQFSPSQETLDALYELECKLVSKDFTAYD